MGTEWLHGPDRGWFATRWLIGRDRARPADERGWALAEIACALVTLATLAVMVVLLVVSWWWPEVPRGGWLLTLLMSGAVGYGTNFLAVQMLFKPREPFTSIPLRWIWRQGLIPAKQVEVAEIVGEQVASRLLTPERAAAELSALFGELLEDDALLARVMGELTPILTRHLPGALDALLPPLVDTLEEPLRAQLTPAKVRAVLVSWLEAWLRDPAARQSLRAFGSRFLRAHSPLLVALLKRVLRRYKKRNSVGGAMFDLGLKSSLVSWDDLEEAVSDVMARPAGHAWVDDFVEELVRAAPHIVTETLSADWLADAARRFVALARQAVSELGPGEVGERVGRMLIDDPRGAEFRRHLRLGIQPAIREWVARGGLTPFLSRFDVRGRVAEAARQLDVRELEDMANRVGAYHLAAIQVLGYVLGVAAGVLMVLVQR